MIMNQNNSIKTEDKCIWKFEKKLGEPLFICTCNNSGWCDLHGFIYCPYCGKKIKIEK